MAHFAKLGVGNIVQQVIVISNDIATTEQAGVNFINQLYNTRDTWKQTSYNTQAGQHTLGGTPFRKNYARIGYTYDEGRDAFIAPKPFNSWVLDEDKAQWKAPVDMPSDDKMYKWNETTTSWIEIHHNV